MTLQQPSYLAVGLSRRRMTQIQTDLAISKATWQMRVQKSNAFVD